MMMKTILIMMCYLLKCLIATFFSYPQQGGILVIPQRKCPIKTGSHQLR